MFVHYNKKIINTDTISCITYDDFVEHGRIHVHYKDKNFECVKGMEAANLIMGICPSAIDGARARHVRHSWAIHNLIGHPLMQIFTWLHLTRLAIWIHDHTVPESMLIE
jgi:hypothetical protein